MELVISISRVTRFVRVGGNALGVNLPTGIPSKTSDNKNQLAQAPRALTRTAKPFDLKRVAQGIIGLKQRPRMLAHVGLSVAVVAIVLVGGLNAGESNLIAQNSQPIGPLSALAREGGYGGVADETASAYIAAGVAQQVDLPLADQVISDTEKLINKVSFSSTSDSFLSKPQLLTTEGALAKGVQKYVVQEGDTVVSIAAHFKISATTVRSANNIAESDEVTAGQTLTILPVDGILHTVADTDTPSGLALIYETSADLIVRYNDAEVDGLKPGSTIVIPGGVLPQRPSLGAAFATSFVPSYGGNGYDYGWCTWHAANRRAASGRPIPSNWGNAIGWLYGAASSGYAVGSAPQPGAVVYHNNIGGWGHVAYVERVTADGAWFSDMNYPIWGGVTQRFVPASEYGSYSFIY